MYMHNNIHTNVLNRKKRSPLISVTNSTNMSTQLVKMSQKTCKQILILLLSNTQPSHLNNSQQSKVLITVINFNTSNNTQQHVTVCTILSSFFTNILSLLRLSAVHLAGTSCCIVPPVGGKDFTKCRALNLQEFTSFNDGWLHCSHCSRLWYSEITLSMNRCLNWTCDTESFWFSFLYSMYAFRTVTMEQ